MKNLFKRYLMPVLILSVSLITICAQQALPDKPFNQWSKKEAETVLNDSQWARKQEIRIKFDKETQAAAGSYSGTSEGKATQSITEVTSQPPVDFIFTMRLRSALPVRQALVRLRQLQTDIEKKSAKELAAFDAQTKGILECPACSENYVVTLSCKSTNSPGADAVYTVFKGGREADLQRFVYIANDHGDRRPLVHFVAPRAAGDEAIFFFQRFDDKGMPLLSVDSKDLFVNLNDNQANSISNFKFDVAKLVLNGKVEF